jgi:hypothetical protein
MASATDDHRGTPRKSLFAAAVLYTSAGSAPVRVRNISEKGALVEGSELPEPETDVRLSRGSLSALGQVRWSLEGKAGIAFVAPVQVANWLSSCSIKGHQERVDELVLAVREGSPFATNGQSPQQSSSLTVPNGRQLTERLVQIHQSIEQIAEALAADPMVLNKHGAELQKLEAVVRVIASLVKGA